MKDVLLTILLFPLIIIAYGLVQVEFERRRRRR